MQDRGLNTGLVKNSEQLFSISMSIQYLGHAYIKKILVVH